VSPSAPADAFGRTARDYERGRPEWRADLVDLLVRKLELQPRAEVLDLAAGTGKLTRRLAARFQHVIAIEPDSEMRALLAEKVPQADASPGVAEEIPLDSESVDAVFVAEAFHWFAAERALEEIARVLRPRGGLALLWNLPVKELEPSLPQAANAAIDEAIARGGEPGGPKYLSGRWREPFAVSPFQELQEMRAEYEELVGREEVISYVLSVSSVASLPQKDREVLAMTLRDVIPERAYRRFLRTDAYWTRLRE
jgi:ubiquinone/menaquinone biosynthesis C-methylase UbiE